MRPLRTLALLAVCVVALAGCTSGADTPDDRGPLLPATATALPSFDLSRFEALLGELEGRPVLVNVWASWCGPCREEAPHLVAAHETYGDEVQFLGVDILDSRESARGFIDEYGWTYPSVFDATGAIRDGLGLLGQPVTLFYDASGALVDTWTGPIPRDELTQRLDAITA